jgi:hypothetical protein
MASVLRIEPSFRPIHNLLIRQQSSGPFKVYIV